MVCFVMNYYLVKDKFMFGYFFIYLIYLSFFFFFKEGLYIFKMVLIFEFFYNVFKCNI